mmetsp:Transcript_9233/g.28330  ORF Transcript_9233/g.28330 Transcript_9233/m.28330 type:complete len:278 (-) Transcript_9233:1084-1917(-)
MRRRPNRPHLPHRGPRLLVGEALDVDGDEVDEDVAHFVEGGVAGEVEAVEAGVGAGRGVVAAGDAGDFEVAVDAGGALEILKAAGGDAGGAGDELKKSRALVGVEALLDDAPEEAAARVVQGDVAVGGVFFPVVDVDDGVAVQHEFEFLGVQQLGRVRVAGDSRQGNDVVEAAQKGRQSGADAVQHGVLEAQLDVARSVFKGDVDVRAAGNQLDFAHHAEGLFAHRKRLAQQLDVFGVVAGEEPREVRVEGGVDELEVVELDGLAEDVLEKGSRECR